MFCPKCGRESNEHINFCQECGFLLLTITQNKKTSDEIVKFRIDDVTFNRTMGGFSIISGSILITQNYLIFLQKSKVSYSHVYGAAAGGFVGSLVGSAVDSVIDKLSRKKKVTEPTTEVELVRLSGKNNSEINKIRKIKVDRNTLYNFIEIIVYPEKRLRLKFLLCKTWEREFEKELKKKGLSKGEFYLQLQNELAHNLAKATGVQVEKTNSSFW